MDADTRQYDWARHQLNEVMGLLGQRGSQAVSGGPVLLSIFEKVRVRGSD